jgi:hypothetical protein
MELKPAGNGEAYHIAVGVKDVDGDWREATYDPNGQGPTDATGNKLWWYNQPFGTAGGLQHTATQYNDGQNLTVYDPTFGVKHNEGWKSYLATAITHYAIKTGVNTFIWKTKAAVNAAGDTVRWQPLKNYAADGNQVVWKPVP